MFCSLTLVYTNTFAVMSIIFCILGCYTSLLVNVTCLGSGSGFFCLEKIVFGKDAA